MVKLSLVDNPKVKVKGSHNHIAYSLNVSWVQRIQAGANLSLLLPYSSLIRKDTHLMLG